MLYSLLLYVCGIANHLMIFFLKSLSYLDLGKICMRLFNSCSKCGVLRIFFYGLSLHYALALACGNYLWSDVSFVFYNWERVLVCFNACCSWFNIYLSTS